MAQIKHVTLGSGALETVKPVVVETIANLRALTEQFPVVDVLGHTTVEDGGGGRFILIDTAGTSGDIGSAGDDDNGFHIVNTSGYIWQRQSDVITPQMFGAFPVMTSAAARADTADRATNFQRAVNFYLYPQGFAGTAHATVQLQSRRFEVPHGLYRCHSTINFFFNSYGSGEPDKSYKWPEYYVPGACLMRGSIWTPYSTSITAISILRHLTMSDDKLQFSAIKDTLNDTTWEKHWNTYSWPQVYVDDTCLRTFVSGTKFYRDEDVKYVSSHVTYILRCTATGTPTTSTPGSLTGSSFTNGTATFYCRGTSRLANSGATAPGKNMDDMFHDTADIGIQVIKLMNSTNVELSAENYAIGVAFRPKHTTINPYTAWCNIDIPRAPGCKCGVMVDSWQQDRKVELGGRLLLKDLPIGSIVWETAYPLANYLYQPWKTWTSEGTGYAVNDIVRYKLQHPAGYHQDDSNNGQYWCWRVTSITTGQMSTVAPTSAECTTSPWTSGGVTMVCIGSYHGTRYTFNGPLAGEATAGNWSESPALLQKRTTDFGWVNDNTFHVRYVLPCFQTEASVPAATSTYGVVMTGTYANNNNHFDMLDMSPAQISSTSALCEGVEYLLYCGTQNTFHSRCEDAESMTTISCPQRKLPYCAQGNTFRTARHLYTAGIATSSKHRGGGNCNLMLGAHNEPSLDARFEVDFSKQLHFSSYNRVYGRGIGFFNAGTGSTLSVTSYLTMALTSEGSGDFTQPVYYPSDDSWFFPYNQAPGVIVDLSNDINGCYSLRVTPYLGDITVGTSRWHRWFLTPLEEDGFTKVSPDLIVDNTVGNSTNASVQMVTELANGIPVDRPLQLAASYAYIYNQGPVYNSRTLMLTVNPLIKKFAFGLYGRHIKGWLIEVIGSPGAKIYAQNYNGASGAYTDTFAPVVSSVPAKGRITAPAMYRYVDGTATATYAKFKMAPGQVYWCTSGITTALTPSTNKMWGRSNSSQGSATISEWDGSTWNSIATNAYYAEPTGTYFEDVPTS